MSPGPLTPSEEMVGGNSGDREMALLSSNEKLTGLKSSKL
jgi:hypothetical protein